MQNPPWSKSLLKAFIGSQQRRASGRRGPANRLGRSWAIEPLEARMLLHGGTDDIGAAEIVEQDLVAFAQDLADAGVEFFGAAWCPACRDQKALFEDGAQFLPFIEVTTFDDPDTAINDLNDIGISENIGSFPTWDFPGGTRRTGVLSLQEISDLSGVPIPTSNLPFVVPIEDQTLLEGAPLNLALDGYDPNGGPLNFEVTSDNPDVSATIVQGNRSWRMTTNGWGDLVFELFEQRATRATNQIIELTESGYYDGVPFHRVIDGFMFQGGDGENFNGTGGSTLGDYDGQFNADALHTSEGLLSAANAGDDTNDSQFFITDQDTRFLDAQHTVFGRLVEGDEIRDAINNTAKDGGDTPLDEVRIDTAEIFTDTENAVLLVKTLNGASSGTANITITVSDQHGNSFQTSFEITLEADTEDTRPFLLDIPRTYTTVDTPVTIQLPAFDVEGDAIVYGNAPANDDATHQLDIDADTGALTVTPLGGFTGTLDVLLGVRSASSEFDTQTISIEVLANAPATVTGTIINDSDLDGFRDAGEGALEGRIVFVDENGDGIAGNDEAFTTTDSSGNYTLTLPAGTFTIKVQPKLGFSATLPATAEREMTLTSGQNLVNQDFGQILNTPTSIDLLPLFDSGSNESDNITNATSLEFRVFGVSTGATVQIFDGNTLVAEAISNGPTVVLPVTDASALTAGDHAFSARQILGTATSGSATLGVAIDRTVDLTVPGNTTVVAGAAIDVNIQSTEEGTPGFAYSLDSGPSGLSIDVATGVVSWTPAVSQAGSHTVAFTAVDGAGNQRAGSFTLDVTAGLPAQNDAYNTDEDLALSVSAGNGVLDNDGDAQSGTLTATLADGPQNGQLTFESDGSFSYTPDAEFSGTDTFTYQATDGTRTTGTTTVTLNVAPVNDPPVASPNTFSVFEDSFFTSVNLGVLVNDQDIDSTSLSAVLVGDVSNGTLNLSSTGFFTYIPDANFNGTDSFTYRASDGDLTSEIVTVTMTVIAENDAPISEPDSYQTDEDQLLTVTAGNGVLANDEDPVEGSPLTASLVSDVANGTLTFSADGSFTYEPDANFNGTDSFTYRGSDGEDETAETTVTITVGPVNDAPVAASESYLVNSGDTLVVDAASGLLANDTDIENETLTARVVTPPSSGTLSLASDGSFSYAAAAGVSGTVSFVYVAEDGSDSSNEVTVTIEVNNAPVAVDDTYEVDEDASLVINVAGGLLDNDDDDENDTLAADLVTGPTNGTLNLLEDGSFSYTPNANFNGSDTFTYLVRDQFQTSNSTATVTITVRPVNDLPTAAADEYRLDRDSTLIVDAADGLLNNDSDIDNDSLSAVVASQPSSGDLTLNSDGSFSYTPDAGFSGVDTFTYRADDGLGTSSPVTVRLTVNQAPQAGDDVYAASEDQSLTISSAAGVLANDSDSEDDPLTASLVDSPARGTVLLNPDGSFTYTPNADYNGDDSFTYRASDSSLDSELATVNITISPVNDAPVAADDTYSTDEDTPLVVEAVDGVFAGDIDIDGDSFTASIQQGPTNGSVTLNDDGSFTYTPGANFNGSDSFTYRINDGLTDSNTATVVITVAPVEDPPEFDSVNRLRAFLGSSIDTTLTANDIDDRGAVFAYSLISAPDGATIDPVTGQFLWTPPEEISGRFFVTAQAADVDNLDLASQITFEIDVFSFRGLILLPLSRRSARLTAATSLRLSNRIVPPSSDNGSDRLILRSSSSNLSGVRRISRLQASRKVSAKSLDGDGNSTDSKTNNESRADTPMSDGTNLTEDDLKKGAHIRNPENSNDRAVGQLEFSTGDVVSMRLIGGSVPQWSRLSPAAYASLRRSEAGGAEILSADELLALARSTSRRDFEQPVASVAPSQATLVENALPEPGDLTVAPDQSSDQSDNRQHDDPQHDIPQHDNPQHNSEAAKTAMRVAAAAYYMPLLVTQIDQKRPHQQARLRRMLERLLR